MDEQIDLSCLTLHVTSPMDACDAESGAVIIQGGIGVAQNMHVGKSIVSADVVTHSIDATNSTCTILTSKTATIDSINGNAVTIKTITSDHCTSDTIQCNELTARHINGVFDKLIPKMECSKLDTHTLNVLNDCAIGSLPVPCECPNEARCVCPGVPILEVSKSQSCVEINCNTMSVFTNAAIEDSTDTNERKLKRAAAMVINHNGIEIHQPLTVNTLLASQQIVRINSIVGKHLPLTSYITFLCLDSKVETSKSLSDQYRCGTVRKIVLRKTKDDRAFVLHINDAKAYRFSREDDYIEIIFDKTKWNFVSGNIRTIQAM